MEKTGRPEAVRGMKGRLEGCQRISWSPWLGRQRHAAPPSPRLTGGSVCPSLAAGVASTLVDHAAPLVDRAAPLVDHAAPLVGHAALPAAPAALQALE
mmetsp:Transcript_105731/g.173706  ORF Transcript_105731/g.173706 Transcript_105731/m.173706 type:complete len:98 (+) Transcript_105731:230-523(+)